jgi:hypothetical protein
MQNQITKESAAEKTTSNNTDLKKRFEQVQAEPVQELTRLVKLKYKQCCGCGCSYTDIIREVPNDSPLKNGDITNTMLDTDKWARR